MRRDDVYMMNDPRLDKRMTLIRIINICNLLKVLMDGEPEPYHSQHFMKQETGMLQYDEGHFLAEMERAGRKAVQAYKDRHDIHKAHPDVPSEDGLPRNWRRP